MYHLRFNGTHYEIGNKWGSTLKKRGINLLDNVPFPITNERLVFAEQCIPFYKKHFPQILHEIKGIADGQQCSLSNLQAVLLSMYSIMPSANCSCFAVRTKGNGVIFGRNSDFLTAIEKLYMNALYRFTNDSYFFNANTTAFVQMEDGINEYGLTVGLTSVAPSKIKPGINAGMLLRLFLERCKNVEELLRLIQTIPIASSQTIIATDFGGNAALIECSPQAMEVQKIDDKRKYVCSTNMFNTEKMMPCNNLPEDTWQAEERYRTMETYLSQNAGKINLKCAQDLLSGKEGFLCQYDRKTEKDTVWSIACDMSEKSLYRAEGNPSRKAFIKDERMKFLL